MTKHPLAPCCAPANTQSADRRPRRRTGAFTLIELLVVISIIALLIGILLPALSRARSASRSAVCGNNLRQIGIGMEGYADEYNDMYPRALPLVDPSQHDDPSQWSQPWPADICPAVWQSCYPSMVVPYLGVRVREPFNYLKLRESFTEEMIPVFQCPENQIPQEDEEQRKCGFELDYGISNWASQNRRHELDLNQHFIASDMTWGLAYVEGSGGPNSENELLDWWTVFIHPGDTASVYSPDMSVTKMTKDRFIRKFTEEPPDDDPI